MAPPSDALVVTRLSKSFAGQRALDDVSIDIRPGEVHCLLGQNGSGKSTLVKVLSGFHTPDPGGTVSVGAEHLAFGDPDSARRLGLRFVHQQLGVIDALSALENASLGFGFGHSRFGVIKWKEQEERTRTLMARVGVTDLDLRRPLREARAVDRTAVAIARAVDPSAGAIRFLFLDEPTAALPPVEVERLFELIAEVKSQGIGIVYVSHRLDEVFRIGERVSVLRDAHHLGTFDVADLSKSGLIRLIVGEEAAEAAGAGGADGPPVTVRPAVSAGEAVSVGEAVSAAAPAEAATPTPATATAPDPRAAVAAPVLAVRNLRSAVLHGVSLELAAGEVLGVAGLAGSGRESLVYALLGAGRARADSIVMAGTDVGRSLSPRTGRLLGVVLAPGNRMPGSAIAQFSLRENITLPVLAWYRRHRVISKSEEQRVARHWLEDLQVAGAQGPDGHDRLFPQLSGGNQQKVILAKAFNTRPSVVLLDEPTAGVDVGAREAIYRVIRRYAAEGVSFIISSSDVDDLLAVCGRVLVMLGGRVERSFTQEQLDETALLDAIMQESAPAGPGALGEVLLP